MGKGGVRSKNKEAPSYFAKASKDRSAMAVLIDSSTLLSEFGFFGVWGRIFCDMAGSPLKKYRYKCPIFVDNFLDGLF